MQIAPEDEPFTASGTAQGPDGTRTGVLLCHGFTGTPASMRPWAEFLHERGYTFVQVGSQFRLTATSTVADVNPVYQDTSDFAGVFYDTTIVPAIVHRLGLDDGRDGRRKNYDAVVWQLDQKFSIFAAYYLPGVDASELYPTMSSVNTFRLILDLYFDADLPLLPDRAWIHRDKHHPFDLTDVTDRLDSFAGNAGAGAP